MFFIKKMNYSPSSPSFSPSSPSQAPVLPFEPWFPWIVDDPASAKYKCKPPSISSTAKIKQTVGFGVLAASLGLALFVVFTNRQQWALSVFYTAGTLSLIGVFGGIFYWTITRGWYTPMADILNLPLDEHVKVSEIVQAKKTSTRCRRDAFFAGLVIAIMVVAPVDEWLSVTA